MSAVPARDRTAELKTLAHDVRNALNGVAVNLEVARSRAQRGVDVAEVSPFLETAAQQLDLATRLHKRYTDAVAAPGMNERHGESREHTSGSDDTHTHT